MGANAKEKRPVNQCEECQKEFQTVRALKSHTMAKHPEKYKQMQALEQREFMSLLGNESASKDEKKTAFVPPTSRVSKRLQEKKSNDKEVEDITSDIPRKTMFGCPKCDRVFHVYFSAYKHIQKNHCEDEYGNSVAPDSPHLIKPVRREACRSCSKVKLNDVHSCGNTSSVSDSSVKGTYCCLGCNRNFLSVAAFDIHIAASHCENIDTMIFKSFNEFLLWKRDLENKVQVKYQSLSHSTQRQFYHCNYISSKNTAEITHLCPSVLVAKEFSKGMQIHFYKKHHEHTCEYQISKQFENYIIKTDTKDAFDSLKTDNDELYIKFRNLLKSIILSAATVKASKLKKLYSLAQEMQTCLHSLEGRKSTDEIVTAQVYMNTLNTAEDSNVGIDIDREEPSALESTEKTYKENEDSKTMTDYEIAQVLEKPRASARLKRKSESSEPVSKKKKIDVKDAIETKPGLKESNAIKDAKIESPKVRTKPAITQSPSFNDSYKQFIDSTLKTLKSPVSKKVAKKETVKTKIGQFIPSPKRALQVYTSSDNVVKKTRSSINSPITTVADVEDEIVPSPKRTAPMKVTSENVDIVKKTRNTSIISPKTAAIEDQTVVPSPKTPQIKMNTEKVDTVGKKSKNANVHSPKTTIAALEGKTVHSPKRQIKVDSEKVNAVKKSRNAAMNTPKSNIKVLGDKIVMSSSKRPQIKFNAGKHGVAIKKNSKITSPKPCIANLNLEKVKYEVLEQENDCNILILKI